MRERMISAQVFRICSAVESCDTIFVFVLGYLARVQIS